MSARNLGRLIREKRERCGLTVAQAAELCGLSDRGLTLIELGDVVPKLSSFIRIAAVLGINLGDIESCKPSDTSKEPEQHADGS